MNDLREQSRLAYLAALGIDVWRVRGASAAGQLAADANVVTGDMPATQAAETPLADWTALRDAVSGCTLCPLHESRTQTVFGVGSEQADLMIIGEAPGAEEDRRGEPFVGRAGKLLDEMLRAIGLDRNVVFIANVLKCRPPGNRDPKPEEAATCRRYLDRQIELLAPRVILAVGRIAAQQLLGSDQPLGRMRGQPHTLADHGLPVIVTYHPAYLLRTPAQKRKSWQDLCEVRRMLAESRP
ncbi:MAG: uracil-DNA glycosylase [Woeseiaceae bacterium]|nr:uracil-DNA glycosylase [Woeseiaceae bacterium]